MLFNDKQQQWSLQRTLLLFSFLLPLQPYWAAFLIVIGLLICFLRPSIFKGLSRFELLDIFAFSTPLLVWLPALLMGEDVGAKVETKLSLFFIPILIALVDSTYLHRLVRNMMKGFFIGLFIAVVYSIFAAMYTYLADGSNTFFYSKLGAYLHFHPSYFSMYLLLGIIFFLLSYQKDWLNSREIAFGFPVLGLFTLFIVLLSSRSQWINFLILAPILVFPILKEKKVGLVKSILLLVGTSIFCGSILLSIPSTRMRLLAVVEKKADNAGSSRVQNVRFQTWGVAWELFKEEPLTGVGVQHLSDRRQERYKASSFEKPFEKKYNAHNQFLDLMAASGFIPLLFWLICLFWQRRVNQFGRFYFLSLLLFLLSFFMESMLETARGVMVFSFVQGMFLLIIKKPDDEI